MNEWSTFAKFYNVSEAESLIGFLKSADIPFRVDMENLHPEPIITGARLEPNVIIQIPADRFAQVNYLLSETPVAEFGVGPLPEEKPEHLGAGWIIAGYLISFLPVIGLLAGIAITTSKKRQWNGKAMHIYDKQSRKHGRYMIGLGTISVMRFILVDVAGVRF